MSEGTLLSRYSISARLVTAALVCSVTVLLLAGLILSALYTRAAERGFDERLHIYLKDLVSDLAAPVDDERSVFGAMAEPRFDLPLSGWYWQVTQLEDPRRELRLSRSLVGTELSPLTDAGVPASIGELREGYTTGPDGRRLRVVERRIDLGEEGRYLIAVGADVDELNSDLRAFNLALGATFTALAVLLAVSALVQVRFGLRPLMALGAAVAAARRGEAERIEGKYPHDIAPLAGELNLLLDTNREVVERSRRHVGNLAHALKTPLSVLRNEAEGAPGPLADKIVEQTALMRDHVTYHLDRARAAALAGTLGTTTQAKPVIEGLSRVFQKLNTQRHLAIEVDIADDLRVRGERQDIEEMLGNLIDNACKWARGLVRIGARVEPGDALSRVAFVIEDDGPGLSAQQRDEAIARGRRLDETKPGSGLGLSIVADLAGLYGGSLALEESELGGLRARLVLPGV